MTRAEIPLHVQHEHLCQMVDLVNQTNDLGLTLYTLYQGAIFYSKSGDNATARELIDRALTLCPKDDPLLEPLQSERDRLTPVSLHDVPFWIFLKTGHQLFAWNDARFAVAVGNRDLFGMFLSALRNFGEEIKGPKKSLQRIVWDDGQTYILHHEEARPFFIITIAFTSAHERAAPKWMPVVYRQFWTLYHALLVKNFKGDVTPFQAFTGTVNSAVIDSWQTKGA